MPPRVPAALADEWPTLLGLGLGVIALWLSIPTRIELPGGSDWGEYIRSADYIWRHTPGAHYTDWRRPLYPYLLGLGALAVGTYARAAVLLATASLYSMVLSAGLAARSLAGPWATLPAAVGVAAVPALLPTVRWANLYPLEGALFGAAFAFGAATLRRGSPPLALLAGTCAGLCTLVDARGALAIPVAAVLVLGGIRRPGQGIALVVLFVLPIVALHLGEARVVEAWHLKQMTILEQLHGQHDLTTTKAGAMAFDNDVTRQCKITTGKPTDLPPLFGVCPDAVRNSNLRALAVTRMFPSPRWFLLAALLFVPRREAWRLWGATLVSYGGMFVAIGLGLGLAAWPERYALPYAVPIVVLAPVVLAGLVGEDRLGPRLAALALAVTVGGFGSGAASLRDASDSAMEVGAQRIADRVAAEVPDGETLLDCTDFSIDLVTLPAQRHTPSAFNFANACDRLQFPSPPPDWLIMGGPTMPDATTAGYELVMDEGGTGTNRITLWRYPRG